jgi:hypothetical protein
VSDTNHHQFDLLVQDPELHAGYRLGWKKHWNKDSFETKISSAQGIMS